MLIHHSYDPRFVTTMEKLRKQYSNEMFDLAGIGDEDLDINRYSKKFYKKDENKSTADTTVDANANVNDFSVFSWENESKKPLMKLNALYRLWLSGLKKHGIKRANKFLEHEIRGAIRIHDLSLWEKPYCYASSLSLLVQQGMPFYKKKHIGPIRHFDSFINLSLQYICYISNQIAGAIALPDFFIYADYFIRKDYGENWQEDERTTNWIRQQFQSWICSVNFSWRSNQSPFTNLSIYDKYWLKGLFKDHVNPDFNGPNFENVDYIQKLFIEVYNKEQEQGIFTFPVMTSCMFVNEDKEPADEEFLDYASEVVAKNGLFNMYSSDSLDSLSSCCRLRNNIEEANKEYMNSFGAGGLNIGSHRVVALNLPQIAYESEDWTEFMKLLEYRINISQDILDIHRETIQEGIENNKLPLYKYGYMNLEKQFSTIGFIGMSECLEIMGTDILEKEGCEKAQQILSLINSLNDKRSKHDGHIRNVEQVPGESAAYNLAKKDSILFEEASYHLYSNQYIPLTKDAGLCDRIETQGVFDSDVGGGSILHLNLKEEIDKEQVKKLIKFSIYHGVMYFAINYNFCECTTCGKIYIGQMDVSPCHSAKVKKYLRVVGFLTEVDNWAKERRNEYEDRKFYFNGSLNVSSQGFKGINTQKVKKY